MKQFICFIAFFLLTLSPLICSTDSSIEDSDKGTIKVTTNVSGAKVFINGSYVGKAPITKKLTQGYYTVRVVKEGYYTEYKSVSLSAGDDITLYIKLEEITGFIDFFVNEPDAMCYIDGSRIYNRKVEVPIGIHSVEVKLFGYETYREIVTVIADLHSTVIVVLKPAVFTVSEVFASPDTFNPGNPGNLGMTRISFEVSAPGSGSILITDENGTVVASHSFAPFTTWDQTWSWDGRCDDVIVADGVYTIHLETMAEPQIDEEKNIINTEAIIRTSSVNIDSSLSYPLLGIGSNGLGVGLVSSSRLYPRGSIATGVTAEPVINIPNGSIHAVPVYCSVVGTPLSWLELSARAGIWFREISPTPLGFGAGIKAAHSIKNFTYAGFIQYEYVTQNLLGVTTEAGLRAGVSGGWRWGYVNLDLCTSFIIGPEQGKFNPFDGKLENSISLLYQKGIFSIGGWGMLDCAVKKPDVEKTFIWNYITGGGLDYSVLLPSTNILLTAKVYCLDDIPVQQIYLFTSLGFTVIY